MHRDGCTRSQKGGSTINPGFTETSKKELMKTLTNELRVLRAKAGVTQQELADRLGVSRQTYGLIENKTQDMSWSQFLALTFLFKNNEDTAKILEWTGVYTPELEEYMNLSKFNKDESNGG